MAEPLSKLTPYVVGITKSFSDMTRAEAVADFNELMARMPQLVGYIESVLREAKVDLSGSPEDILTGAGEWLVQNGRLVRTRSFLPAMFGDDDEPDLSVPTMSACCYVGRLFGEMLVKNVPGTAWVLVTDNKRDIDYHQAVIRPEDNRTQVEPIRIVMNFARSRLTQTHSKDLANFYRIWRDALL